MSATHPDVISRGLLGAVIASFLCLGTGPCKWINDPVSLPTPGPGATPFGPTPSPSATPTPIPPQGAWHPLPPVTPPQDLLDAVNAAAQKAGNCPEGDPSRCVVGIGFPGVSREQEAANATKFGRDVCAVLWPKGWFCGFHEEDAPGDELAIARSIEGPFYGIKIATLGGQIVIAWARMPRGPCFGGANPEGDDPLIFPPKIGCPGVGGGSYRGAWAPGAGE